MLKTLTYFEMLNVPHALHCVHSCFFVFCLNWQSGILFWFQYTPSPAASLPHPHPTHPPTPHPPKISFLFFYFSDLDSLSDSLTRELKIRVVGFVLKKLLTYFEMLIVPHALHWLCFTSFDNQDYWFYCFGFTSPPPTPTHTHNFVFRFRFFVKINLQESSK